MPTNDVASTAYLLFTDGWQLSGYGAAGNVQKLPDDGQFTVLRTDGDTSLIDVTSTGPATAPGAQMVFYTYDATGHVVATGICALTGPTTGACLSPDPGH